MTDLHATVLLARADRWRGYSSATLDTMLEYESRSERLAELDDVEPLRVYHRARVEAIQTERKRRKRVAAGFQARDPLGAYSAEIIKDQVPIEEYVQSHVDLKPAGRGRWVGLCPMHQERTPSFTVYQGRGFYCYGCGVGGDIFGFAQLAVLKRDDFVAAVHEVAVWAGLMTRPTPANPQAPIFAVERYQGEG